MRCVALSIHRAKHDGDGTQSQVWSTTKAGALNPRARCLQAAFRLQSHAEREAIRHISQGRKPKMSEINRRVTIPQLGKHGALMIGRKSGLEGIKGPLDAVLSSFLILQMRKTKIQKQMMDQHYRVSKIILGALSPALGEFDFISRENGSPSHTHARLRIVGQSSSSA